MLRKYLKPTTKYIYNKRLKTVTDILRKKTFIFAALPIDSPIQK